MDQVDRLAALRIGNAAAIRQWAAEYAPGVRQVGLSYLGNAEEAAALTKEVLSQALSAIRSGYTPADMADWLLTLARARGSQAALSKPAQPLPSQAPRPIIWATAATQPAMGMPVEAAPPAPPAPEPVYIEPQAAAPAQAAAISLYDEEAPAPWEEPLIDRPSPFKRFFGGLLLLLLSLVVLALLWALAGLVMRLGVLPAYDAGYSWFNSNIYPFF